MISIFHRAFSSHAGYIKGLGIHTRFRTFQNSTVSPPPPSQEMDTEKSPALSFQADDKKSSADVHVGPNAGSQPSLGNLFEDGSVDPVYEAKAHLLNHAVQEIGMGRYQVSFVMLGSGARLRGAHGTLEVRRLRTRPHSVVSLSGGVSCVRSYSLCISVVLVRCGRLWVVRVSDQPCMTSVAAELYSLTATVCGRYVLTYPCF